MMEAIDISLNFTYKVQLWSHLVVIICFDIQSTNKELQNDTNPISVAQSV